MNNNKSPGYHLQQYLVFDYRLYSKVYGAHLYSNVAEKSFLEYMLNYHMNELLEQLGDDIFKLNLKEEA